MKLLVLGGTQFLGYHLVETALAGGHEVTLFNRGRTNPGLFPNVEALRGDRGGDLEALKGRTWDAAIDTCGFSSTRVRAATERLKDSVAHYTFISSISVYRDFHPPMLTESAPLQEWPPGKPEDESDEATYGARKALCERAAEASMPGRVLIVRPGILIGPRDPTGRFGYWLRRCSRGGEVLAPGRPEAPIQLIDARDAALWILGMAGQNAVGSYHLTGPVQPMTFGGMLRLCGLAAGGGELRFTWADDEFLLAHGVKPFVDLPFWIPQAIKDYAGFFTVNSGSAGRAGLTCRPLDVTAKEALQWERSAGTEPKRVGLTLEREQELLHAAKRIAAGS